MILDNKNENKKVYQWLKEYTESGKIDIVTGYFTVGALSYLSHQINEKIQAFRMVLGDIVNIDMMQDRTIDLLSENIAIEAALKLSSVAKEAVEFLKQEKVEAKTLEPNFCHAKVYLFNPEKDDRHKYFISGSSNLTEAGIGLKETNNIELNIAETGNNNQYLELVKWFDELWKSKEAHKSKTIVDESGKKHTTPFKEYLIEAIERIFIKYTPKQLYYKVLFELFGNQLLTEQDNPEFNRQVGRLENTVIYNTLYDFQQKGVLSIIRMIQKYDGAILADAVGLGKTWSALAIMKFFQMQGREIILVCPKKLQHNWHRYRRHQNSKFEKDQLEYFIRYHTDMHTERMERYTDIADKFFVSEKPKLFVIDESHNLRNGKSQRYNFLVNEILKKNDDAKVLMLTATPINNTLIDIRNQFKLVKQGNTDGFYESHSIRNVDHLFNRAQHAFFKWREGENLKIADFIKILPSDFFRLTDSLTVARTRPMIEKQNTGLFFPKKRKPENIFVTPKQIGNFDSFEELFDHFPPLLSGYQPTFYIEQSEYVEKIHDERQRDRFLVKMLYILLVKRLESSWFSFHSTVGKILAHHQNALDKINQYEQGKKNVEIEDAFEQDIFDEDEQEDLADDLSLGKKRPISLAEIDSAGNLGNLKKDLKKDIDALDLLNRNLLRFRDDLTAETKKPRNYKSKDEKLQSLIEKINEKRDAGKNENNPKVVIFTVYKDTAFYLFDQLIKRGFKDLAVISGDVSKTDSSAHETKLFEPILERFAPFTKLFNEKEWSFIPSSPNLTKDKQYTEWLEWLSENDKKTYEQIKNPIDILISTDVLSEGQNLQDCDMVINYDIHWNPVRVIQRMGRIDRLGSPNKEIFGINYWPSDNINTYLNLKGRIEERMAMMKLAGSEVNLEFSDSFKEMATDADFEHKMNEKMLKQMQTSWDDIEGHESGLGFDNLSLEDFRQDLLAELQKDENFYKRMPKGVYTGFKADKSICPENGIIALLGFPAKPPKALSYEYQTYDLIYIDKEGKQVLLNQKEVLDALSLHKEESRFVPEAIEKGEEEAIGGLVNTLKKWLEAQSTEEEILEDGTVKKRAGSETKDILSKLKTGDSLTLTRVKQNISVSEKYQLQNFDLITWFLVN
ncbi:helicase-related protein [Candidatus Kuenenia stuttgartiensis]|nr:helicase-related protein [Candidatus Kuenenia stuttgartiensis]